MVYSRAEAAMLTESRILAGSLDEVLVQQQLYAVLHEVHAPHERSQGRSVGITRESAGPVTVWHCVVTCMLVRSVYHLTCTHTES